MNNEQNRLDDDAIMETPRRLRRPLIGLALLGLAGLSLCLVAALFLRQGEIRPLRPFRTDPTAIALILNGQPQLVTFPELSEDAAAYLNQRIRVTGFYLPVTPPDCAFFNGPVFRWSLVSEGLQLNAQGFERALSLLAPGTTLTVEGIWRLYNGPYGCGKGPETMDVWYLQVERIVQPNPLVETTADPRAFILSGISTPMFPTVGPTGTPRPATAATATFPSDITSTVPGGTGTAVPNTPVPTSLPTTIGGATSTATRPFTATPTGTLTTPGATNSPPLPTLTTPGATNTPLPAPTNPPINPYPGATNEPPLPGATPTPTPNY
jgi:hypothetical protein